VQPLTVPKREPKRSRVFLVAQVDSGTGPVEARIRDISRSGALLESDAVPEAGAGVRLTCGGAHLDARVAWAEDGCFGLEFETPLLVGKLIDQSGSKLNVSAPRGYRRGDFDALAG
jgi:hypothetical protein